MSLHKLTAGSGYDYLTRQVAAHDRTEGARPGLASYYAEKGETPGSWVGSGLAGLEGLAVGDEVTAEQMQLLFGSGHHPLAPHRHDRLEGPGLTEKDYQAVARLGAPYRVHGGDVSAFRLEVAQRMENLVASHGHPRDYPLTLDERARVRTQVAVEFFTAEHGRPPTDAREVAATIARHSRQRTTAVAGYDLTFSPVKSISTLWAVAPVAIAAQIELAHHDAVNDALAFIEKHALYSREGARGVRQVDVTGLVATAFTHRDSRAGDPDLHTHVAVANKVQTHSGKWLAIDGRVLFNAAVTASETYNTAIEKHLKTRLGLTFAEREGSDRGKHPIREVVGVDPRLNQRWSTRRVSIEARRSELATAFQTDHGRPPTVIESIHLAQQATLETRDAKHESRTLTEQRTTWTREAAEVLGGPDSVTAMVTAALSPTIKAAVPEQRDPAWLRTTASTIVTTLQETRSTWQVWHVRSEAHRRIRAAALPGDQVEAVVDLLVDEVLTTGSVQITRPQDDITEPEELRRADGSSVYEVAGSALFTSAAILAAEHHLVEVAGRHDGRTASHRAVAIALLEHAANELTLNAGQAALVTGMATSGVRLQLGIAPAGAGKTTAMRALATAWDADGGTVIGLAPSAAAAALLRDQLGARTDTLAKLTWSIARHDLPDWAQNIGPATLVVVDEAGMADTLSLAAAVDFVIARGGSVRLIGDDQQLAAIGAGGVLRDIAATHGALHLTELMRFVDPAEGAASLALRDGQPEALGFYLDRDRVHVGDLGVVTDDVFTSWARDRADGLDSIMLAPTRELTSQLNQRAQAHRLAGPITPGAGVPLADGNTAYVGEQVITRSNDRRYRISATDWVKNGDRWTVLATDADGSLTVQHAHHGRVLTLPRTYVAASTELGYATTVHGAQGVSADTMHGVATGTESRQQLYTMLTRGRRANHLYLQVVGDGDPHTVIRPENLHPQTATDLLQGILARDDSPLSASTMLAELADPATRLTDAADRYVDALHVAAEHHLGRAPIARLDAGADRVVDGITDDPAWPTLRAHLILLATNGGDPLTHLQTAVAARELDTAGDRAAVLDWRLDDPGLRDTGPAPLPWLPAIPTALRTDGTWGSYLAARADLVTDLTTEVHDRSHTAPTLAWVCQGRARPDVDVLADVAVWRAATGVPDTDERPTGPKQLAKAPALWQRHLDARVTGGHSPALAEWGPLLEAIAPAVRKDGFTPVLAERLAAISRAGLSAHVLLRAVVAEGALPDDHSAAALWWRISRHLSPAVANRVDDRRGLTPTWTTRVSEAIGPDRAAQLQGSPWWPSLVTVIEHALARGQALDSVIDMVGRFDPAVDVDHCQALVWRLSIMASPPSPLGQSETPPPSPEDIDAGMPADAERWWPGEQSHLVEAPTPDQWAQLDPSSGGEGARPDQDTRVDDVATDLAAAALYRQSMGVLEHTDTQIQRMLDRAAAWDHSVADQDRLTHINAMAMDFYAARVDTGWAGAYLDDRLPGWRTSPLVTAGYAPASWTALADHLGGRGVTDDELLETGLATRARTGNLIDRFRDRAILPITHEHQILGFVARRHPDLTDDDRRGPKYLNTATTVLFHKGAQLFGTIPELLRRGALPVLVEGPFDALAVALAGQGRYVGVAPLGTALTDEQARQLATLSAHPIVATDADLPGRVAAERAFWLLAQHGADPLAADLPDGTDPASVLNAIGAEGLRELIDNARPLGQILIDERHAKLPAHTAFEAAVRVTAARPPSTWAASTTEAANRADVDSEIAIEHLRAAVTTWNHDPAHAATGQLGDIAAVQTRLDAQHGDPSCRWGALADQSDPRLTTQSDWPALARMLQQLDDAGRNVPEVVTRVTERPLGDLPAQELRYRLVAGLADWTKVSDSAEQIASHRSSTPNHRRGVWVKGPSEPRSRGAR